MKHEYVKPIVKKEQKKMKMLVEAVSKFGFKAINGNESIWHNADKKALPDLSPIRQGDEIEADVNGKWVKSFTIISRGNPVENKKPEGKPQGGNSYVQPVSSKETSEVLIRMSVANAFGPVFAHFASNADESEAYGKTMEVLLKLQGFVEGGV